MYNALRVSHSIRYDAVVSTKAVSLALLSFFACAGEDMPEESAPDSGTSLCYTETLLPSANIDDIVTGYGGADYKSQVIAAVGRYWPGGVDLLQTEIDNENFERFTSPSSWVDSANEITTLTHEMTHIYNFGETTDDGHLLYFRGDLQLKLPSDSNSFPRSEISQHMAVFAEQGQYGQLYFTGEPGTRGFNALLDELSCYTNELPVIPLFDPYFEGFGISARDGSVAFLYFMQLYLKVAREDHPEYYEEIRSSPAVVDAVVQSWLRVHWYLEHVEGYEKMGIDDAAYRTEMYKAENLSELQEFSGVALGNSSCALP